jgi:hypothetical protein
VYHSATFLLNLILSIVSSDAVINGIALWSSFSDCLLLVHRNTSFIFWSCTQQSSWTLSALALCLCKPSLVFYTQDRAVINDSFTSSLPGPGALYLFSFLIGLSRTLVQRWIEGHMSQQFRAGPNLGKALVFTISMSLAMSLSWMTFIGLRNFSSSSGLLKVFFF